MKEAMLFFAVILSTSCARKSHQNLLSFQEGRDITKELQQVVQIAAPGDTLVLPAGEFFLSQTIMFYKKKNLTVLAENTTLTMKPGTAVENGKGMIDLVRCDGIRIFDLELDANRDTRSPKEVSCHTVNVVSSDNVLLENVKAINSVVDGFYIACYNPEVRETLPKNTTLKNCSALNSFRNGLSIINGIEIRVLGGEYSYSNGTAPAAGIDVEPNDDTNHSGALNITLMDIELKGNDGWGVLVSQKGTPTNVNITNCTITDCYGGVKHTGIKSTVSDNDISFCDVGIESLRYGGRAKDFNALLGNSISNVVEGIKYGGFGGKIKNNKISKVVETAIFLNGSSIDPGSITIENNSITNVKRGLHSNNFKNVVFKSNNLEKVREYAAYLTNGKQLLDNNTFTGSRLGIYSAGSQTSIIGNEIYVQEGPAIQYRGSSYGTMGGKVVANTILSDGSRAATVIDAPAEILKERNTITKSNK